MIIDTTYFNKSNDLKLPLAISSPSSVATNNGYITDLIERVEKDVLLNALGYDLYKELSNAIGSLDPLPDAFDKLVNGFEKWEGLKNNHSLLAYRVVEVYHLEQIDQLAISGVNKIDSEKSTNSDPSWRISRANQTFIKKYQEGYLSRPIVYGNFTDYYGDSNPNQLSLFQFLRENKSLFESWSIEFFKCYETKNSFGL